MRNLIDGQKEVLHARNRSCCIGIATHDIRVIVEGHFVVVVQ